MKVGEKEIPHSGVYETIDRPRQLVFTWESPHSIDGSTVTVDFAPVDVGTRVTLERARQKADRRATSESGGSSNGGGNGSRSGRGGGRGRGRGGRSRSSGGRNGSS